jgi:hypothetical protein
MLAFIEGLSTSYYRTPQLFVGDFRKVLNALIPPIKGCLQEPKGQSGGGWVGAGVGPILHQDNYRVDIPWQKW